MSELQAEFRCPFRDGLKRDGDAALSQQIFDVAKAQREPIIEPYRMGNDLSRKPVASEVGMRGFGHENPNIKSVPTSRLSRRHLLDMSWTIDRHLGHFAQHTGALAPFVFLPAILG